MGKRESNIFVYDCGTYVQIAIYLFFTTKLIVFEVKVTGIQPMAPVQKGGPLNDL